jgi:chemotaxis protein methyltransferase CheR
MRRNTAPFGDGVTLKPEDFRLLRDLFTSRAGLQFGPEFRYTMERRLRDRLMVRELSSFSEYHHYLRFGARASEEWDEAIDLLTTNETYFFREDRQLRAFQNEILPMLHAQARTRRRIAVWSAGCSTGEEVYTIAMLLAQSRLFPQRPNGSEPPESARSLLARSPSDRPNGANGGWDVKVYGSDISRRCVTAARRGIYGESSFRATPDELRRSYFRSGPEGWNVLESVRQVCHFGQMNLLDRDRPRVIGNVDAIFCRNVLIYFDARSRKTAIERLYERLHPGGVLLLGHSESLLNVSTAFELLHLRDDLVYRKPLSPGPGPGVPPRSEPSSLSEESK